MLILGEFLLQSPYFSSKPAFSARFPDAAVLWVRFNHVVDFQLNTIS